MNFVFFGVVHVITILAPRMGKKIPKMGKIAVLAQAVRLQCVEEEHSRRRDSGDMNHAEKIRNSYLVPIFF